MKVWVVVSLVLLFNLEYAWTVTSYVISIGVEYKVYVLAPPILYHISAPAVAQVIVIVFSVNANSGTAGGWTSFCKSKFITFMLEYLYGYAFSSRAHPKQTVKYLNSGRSGNR